MIFPLSPLLLGAALAAQASGAGDTQDPAFEKIPFDQWLRESGADFLHWKASVTRPELTFHQRLMARIEIGLDGRELDTRRGDGMLAFFIQVTDSHGTRYRDHGGLDLKTLSRDIAAANVSYSERAFLLPGDYALAVAVLDTRTGEHSARQTQFRVAGPGGFLEEAWRGLPPVEFIGNEESPASWYLPDIQGRVQWAASARSTARINVILNLAPPTPGSHRTESADLAALLPTLKALTQSGSPSVQGRVEVLDLARRRTAFQQDGLGGLDWPKLKAALGEANSGFIDVHSLSERHHDAEFFVSRVRDLIRSTRQPCVLAVLTTRVAFEPGEDLAAISLEDLPACRVFYVRYSAPVESVRSFGRSPGGFGGRGHAHGMDGPMNRDRFAQRIADQLEATLKPLSPKVFDVETPAQMTQVLAGIAKALLP